jgi:hypothetical protein
MFEYDFSDQGGEGVQGLPHLQQPLQGYNDYFRDRSIGTDVDNTTRLRNNKRKLPSTDLQPRSVMNLRHRQVSNETMKWLASYDNNSPSAKSTHPVSDTDENDASFNLHPPLSLTPASRHEPESALAGILREPVEELWLGPVFESSQTVLTAIVSLPSSVTHLDLDLRNALHLLPQAMPLLFGKHHLKTLSLRVYGDAGAVELAKWMNENPNLEHLDLRENRIGSVGARRIVNAITACYESHGVGTGSRKHHNLTHLNLSCNCILHGDMIGELLAVNSTLEVLDLGFNWLGDEEVQDICEGLCKNTALRELNLYGCHRISNKGLKTILRCLKQHNTSLHKIGLQAFDEEGKRIIEEISYWVKLNRAGRYLIKSCLAPSAISSEQDNQSNDQQLFVQSGDSVAPAPMALWPRALEKSNKDPDPIYHLVREGFVLNQR